MVNVPQAVWIDEAGRIVRPPETAGSTDHFRVMDPATRTLAAEHQAADLDEVGKASGEAFWQRVQALGARPYYPPPDLL